MGLQALHEHSQEEALSRGRIGQDLEGVYLGWGYWVYMQWLSFCAEPCVDFPDVHIKLDYVHNLCDVLHSFIHI